MNIYDHSIGKHSFPSKAIEFGFDPVSLHKDVFDIETWIARVDDLAEQNASIGYENNQIRGDAFEHFVECIIDYFGQSAEINCVDVQTLKENTDGIDLIGKTESGQLHAHQCKFRKDIESILNSDHDNLDVFASACFSNNVEMGTIWTTAKGIHPRTQARFQDKIRTFGYPEISEIVDGDDGIDNFWRYYTKSLGATPERILGSINTPESLTVRDYQAKALTTFKQKIAEATDLKQDTFKGRYVYPTGAGKTLIECLILNFQMKRLRKVGIHVVVAPKIALVNQLMRDYRENIGDGYLSIGFHSGANTHFRSNDGFGRTQRNTTDISRVLQSVENAQRQKRHLVIFSTYDSLYKLAQSHITFETLIADESQYCVSEHYFDQVRTISSKVKLFFTATEKHGLGDDSDERRSNDNEKVFGPLLGYETYANLIERGILVKPLIHLLIGNREKRNRDSIVDESIYIANKQRRMTEKQIHSKVLFACDKTDSIKIIVDKHIEDIKRGTRDNHRIFTIISDPNYKSMIDGRNVDDRLEFLGNLKSYDGNAMIFHYNILSEGIDVEGITGVAVLRSMGKSKLLQTVGRSMRPLRSEIDVPIDRRRKKFSYVSVPVIDGNVTNSEILRNVIRGMITGGLEVSIEEFEFQNEDTEEEPETEWGSDGKPVQGTSKPKPNAGGIKDRTNDFLSKLRQTKLKNVKHKVEEIKREVKSEVAQERRREEERHRREMEEILYQIEPDVMEEILAGRL